MTMAIWWNLGRAALSLAPLLTLMRHPAKKKPVMNTYDQNSFDCLKLTLIIKEKEHNESSLVTHW